jgi:cytochrome c553
MRALLLYLVVFAWSEIVLAQNLERGKEINQTCAACHGEFGQGGKKGEYPRIGGQKPLHIAEQLRNFRNRKRLNMAMFPYSQERELPDEDITDVAAYLASIVLPTRPPDFKDSDDALTRLLAMEKVMTIGRLDGDLENGKTIYQDRCADCHGTTGLGKARFPMLVGQYTNYLRRQIDEYIRGDRVHEDDESKGILARISERDINDVLAYITHLQSELP